MGNKKTKSHPKGQEKPSPVMIPDDDPYWKISSENLDTAKGRRTIERFERFVIRHPQWAKDILTGVPTYYAVLGVSKGINAEELRRCYEREMNFSAFLDETIEEAFAVLSDLQLRVQYDECLRLFEASTAYAPPDAIKELREIHDKYLRNAQLFRRVGEFQKTYHDYVLLTAKGMPDIFKYSRLSRTCSDEEIRKYASDGDEVSAIISSLLLDPQMREKFIFVAEFFETIIEGEGKEKRNRLKKVWKTFSKAKVRQIMLMTLTQNKGFEDVLERMGRILSLNHDWNSYLPPSDTSFFSVLGVDEKVFSLPKGEVESLLRTKYRTLERTPVVNLAYTVLKNPAAREDYFWMRNHNGLMEIADALEKEEDKTSDMDDMNDMDKIIEATLRMMEKNGDMPFSRSHRF